MAATDTARQLADRHIRRSYPVIYPNGLHDWLDAHKSESYAEQARQLSFLLGVDISRFTIKRWHEAYDGSTD